MDIWIFFFFFAFIDNGNISVQISESLLSILLAIYPEVELMDHIVILHLIFWATLMLFSISAAPFYILIHTHTHTHTYTKAILMDVKWYFIVVVAFT